MYLIRRTSTVPNSPLTVQLDGPPVNDGDAGLQQGGVFYFMPAGQDGDRHQVSEFGALAIMRDPGLAQHFDCDPPLPGAAEPEAEAVAAPAGGGQQDSTSGGKRRRKAADQG